MTDSQPPVDKKHEGQSANAGSVGGYLRYEREKRHLSVDEIARDLCLSPEVIRRLEAEKFEELPYPVYIRGYIRGYCKLLNIASEPLLDRLVLPSPETQDETDEANSASEDVYRLTRIWGSLAVLCVVILLLSFWWFDRSDQGNPTFSDIDEELPVVPDSIYPQGIIQSPAVQGSDTEDTEGVVPVLAPAVSADAQSTQDIVRAPSAPTVVTSQVIFSVAGRQSWVNIIDGRGETLVSATFDPGHRETLDGVFPLSVRLGDARGVRIWIDAKEYDLQEDINPDNNTAFFRIEGPL